MYVYIVKYWTKNEVKIGKANDVTRRLRDLGGLEKFDLANSYFLKMGSQNESYRVEKILHGIFKPWKINPDENNRYDGDCEIFQSCITDRLVLLLGKGEDLFGKLESLELLIKSVPAGSLISSSKVNQVSEALKKFEICNEELQKVHQNLKLFFDYVSRHAIALEWVQSAVKGSRSQTRWIAFKCGEADAPALNMILKNLVSETTISFPPTSKFPRGRGWVRLCNSAWISEEATV